MENRLPLRERKQLQARERIVRAANDLFRERGFDAVSVTDIVDHAEVGRTTFFRYFGDKQEVVFAEEQAIVDVIAREHRRKSRPAPASVAEAMTQLREIVVSLSALVTANVEDFTSHYELVDANPDLQARDALKLQRFAQLLADILIVRGADRSEAVLASQVAGACYQAARLSVGQDSGRLGREIESAFDQLLRLGDRERT